MRATREDSREGGYVITERGRLDLQAAPPCNCNPRLAGLLIECAECGTVYGSLRDSAAWGAGRGDWKR